MSTRPKSTDTEDDLQKMQDEYLKQRNDENFRPAAVVVNKRGKYVNDAFSSVMELRIIDFLVWSPN